MSSPLSRKELYDLGKKCYYNPQEFHEHEFKDDLKILGFVKRQVKLPDEEINFHLVLNHIITLTNVFGSVGTVALLRGACEEEYYPVLNSYFFYLGILPRGETEVKLHVPSLFWLTEIFEGLTNE